MPYNYDSILQTAKIRNEENSSDVIAVTETSKTYSTKILQI